MSITKISSTLRAERSSILNAYANRVKKNTGKGTLKATIEDLIKRTGIAEYIKTIYSEQNQTMKIAQVQTSLLDVSYIKEAIDKGVASHKYDNFVDLLNELQKIISIDTDIPKELSYVQNNVFQDKKLVEYVKGVLPEKTNISYDLGSKEPPATSDPTKDSYFEFVKDNKDKPV
jgi:hypothetical protein